MICDPCADQADAWPGIPHRPDICENRGKDIKACTCQHGAETPPAAPHDPQEPPR